MTPPTPTALAATPPTTAEDLTPKAILLKQALELQPAKAGYPWQKTLMLGLLAGAFIGFGCEISTLIAHDATPIVGHGLNRMFAGAVFSVGLMFVMIAGGELFTGNTLMLSSLWLGKVRWHTLLANWGKVYVANFIGSVALAALVVWAGTWEQNHALLGAYAVKTAVAKVTLPFGEAFARGILCNLLVCLAVWQATACQRVSGKVLGIFFPIMTFIALGYEHCIANMFYIPKALFLQHLPTIQAHYASLHVAPEALSHLTWLGFLHSLLPVTLGNIVGGGVFVGLAYTLAFMPHPHPETTP
ncbi:MAG: formate/nitrite transporter family protein [Vampirovibrionales bacterium]